MYAGPPAYSHQLAPQQGYPPQAYPPPGYPPPGFAPQAFAPPPAPGRRRLLLLVTAVAAAVVLIAAGVLFLPGLLAPAGSNQTVEISGGDIGKPIELTGPDGTGTATVTGARWTTEGEVAPEPGTRYLILDVRIDGVSGELTTGGVFTAIVSASGERHGLSYGPVVDPVLISRALTPGENITGQLGYQLRPGAARVEFQTPDGVVLGSAEIPGP